MSEIKTPLSLRPVNGNIEGFDNTKNESMAKTNGVVVVDVNRCKGCELCIYTCPHDVLANKAAMVNSKGYHYVYMEHPDDCTGCTNCAVVCPDGVLTVYRKKEIQKKVSHNG